MDNKHNIYLTVYLNNNGKYEFVVVADTEKEALDIIDKNKDKRYKNIVVNKLRICEKIGESNLNKGIITDSYIKEWYEWKSKSLVLLTKYQ